MVEFSDSHGPRHFEDVVVLFLWRRRRRASEGGRGGFLGVIRYGAGASSRLVLAPHWLPCIGRSPISRSLAKISVGDLKGGGESTGHLVLTHWAQGAGVEERTGFFLLNALLSSPSSSIFTSLSSLSRPDITALLDWA